jgi:hypothetical protein
VQGVVPSAEVSDLLKENFVGLASDCDSPEPQVVDLVAEHLADGMMLPFILFTDENGKFLTGSHGGVNPNTFRDTLQSLIE